MGELVGVGLRPHNRYARAKVLRQRWRAPIQNTLSRTVLLTEEAPEMRSSVLEPRLLYGAPGLGTCAPAGCFMRSVAGLSSLGGRPA